MDRRMRLMKFTGSYTPSEAAAFHELRLAEDDCQACRDAYEETKNEHDGDRYDAAIWRLDRALDFHNIARTHETGNKRRGVWN